MKRHFSAMTAQQAPAPRQARLLGADQTASTKAQRMTGGTVTANSATARTVRVVLETLLNRLARSQPNGPAAAGGRGSAASGSSCVTSVICQRGSPSPRLRGEGWGEGPLFPAQASTCHREAPPLTRKPRKYAASDLSLQAGRGRAQRRVYPVHSYRSTSATERL